jgi:prepilin-type N-terminal cleavage/methylation domain-containing protein
MRARGFTLIELMIAIGLGLTIAVVAFTAVRMASQAVSVANRLTLENQMMRAGFRLALDELDTWKRFDDDTSVPAVPRLLRAWGRPFNPMAFHALSSEDPGAPATSDKDLDFDVSNPKTWWRGTSINFHGRYGNFGVHTNFEHDEPSHRWYGIMLRDFSSQLGYYGMLDYMPAGTIYSCYYNYLGDTRYEFYNVSHGPTDGDVLYNSDAAEMNPPLGGGTRNYNVPRDIYPLTMGCAYVVTTDPAYLAKGAHRHIFMQWNDMAPLSVKSTEWSVLGLTEGYEGLKPATNVMNPLERKPKHWPELTIGVRHFVMSARFWASATIQVTSPLTGDLLKLHFSTHTTTLRGARRQRGLDSIN